MDNWQNWIAMIVSFLFSIVGIDYKLKSKRFNDFMVKSKESETDLRERITKLESKSVTEKEVRQVLKDYFNPFTSTLVQVREDVKDIKVQIDRLPKRKEDD